MSGVFIFHEPFLYSTATPGIQIQQQQHQKKKPVLMNLFQFARKHIETFTNVHIDSVTHAYRGE